MAASATYIGHIHRAHHGAEHHDLRKSTKIDCLPSPSRAVACATTTRLQIAAADRLRQHAAGPWTGGDGPDASQPDACAARVRHM